MNDYSDIEYESDVEFTLEDYVNHPETKSILEDVYFDSIKKSMSDKIESYYKNELDYSEMHFMNIFNKDYDGKLSYDFFLTIYPFIEKKYDISIFDQFPSLTKCLIVENDEEKVEKKKPVAFESKTYDWGAEKI